MSRDNIKKESMRKDIGLRFKESRNAIKKTQSELADEMDVNITTISNIERGNNFPAAYIQHYLHHKYKLNINWLFNEEEEMFLPTSEKSKYADLPPLFLQHKESDPMFEKLVELMRLLRIPFVKKIILAKLEEIKLMAKEEIKKFFEET